MHELQKLVDKNGIGTLVACLADLAEKTGHDKEFVNKLWEAERAYDRAYGNPEQK